MEWVFDERERERKKEKERMWGPAAGLWHHSLLPTCHGLAIAWLALYILHSLSFTRLSFFIRLSLSPYLHYFPLFFVIGFGVTGRLYIPPGVAVKKEKKCSWARPCVHFSSSPRQVARPCAPPQNKEALFFVYTYLFFLFLPYPLVESLSVRLVPVGPTWILFSASADPGRCGSTTLSLRCIDNHNTVISYSLILACFRTILSNRPIWWFR